MRLGTRVGWLHGLRRGAWSLGLGVVLLVCSIPALDDLRTLLHTLGVAALVVGALVVVSTAVSEPEQPTT